MRKMDWRRMLLWGLVGIGVSAVTGMKPCAGAALGVGAAALTDKSAERSDRALGSFGVWQPGRTVQTGADALQSLKWVFLRAAQSGHQAYFQNAAALSESKSGWSQSADRALAWGVTVVGTRNAWAKNTLSGLLTQHRAWAAAQRKAAPAPGAAWSPPAASPAAPEEPKIRKEARKDRRSERRTKAAGVISSLLDVARQVEWAPRSAAAPAPESAPGGEMAPAEAVEGPGTGLPGWALPVGGLALGGLLLGGLVLVSRRSAA